MTLFWTLTAVLILAALFFVLYPLFSQQVASGSANTRTKENVAAYKGQLAELKATLEAGSVTQAEYHEFELELQQNLLEDEDNKASGSVLATQSKIVWALVAILVPVLTIGLYNQLGSADDLVIAQEMKSLQQGRGEQSVETMVARLKSKLEQSPDNVEGWFLLARTYFRFA